MFGFKWCQGNSRLAQYADCDRLYHFGLGGIDHPPARWISLQAISKNPWRTRR